VAYRLVKYVILLSELLNRTSKFAILVLTATTVLAGAFNVFNRSVTQYPVAWTEALIRYSLIWIVLLTLPVLVKDKKLISIDVIVSHFTGRLSKAFTIISFLATVGFCVLMLVMGLKVMSLPIVRLQNVATLNVSKFWIYASIVASSIITLVHLGILFWQELSTKSKDS
jgi:TRAP-type C4-dicarboxylate transport system permease small subunit